MQSKAGMLARAGVLAALLVPAAAFAQYESVPGPAAYALQNVTVVQADGRRQENVTVVVRGALIEAIGRDVAVPEDAERLGGDSLIVYPGLVDADGEAAHQFPEEEIDRSQIEIWNAPRSLQGFMPSRRVVAHLEAPGSRAAERRREGIVAAAVHPHGAMMGGRGVLLLYRKDAELPERMVVEAALGPRFELNGGEGVYPNTLFGVMAFYRQAFEDARHRRQVATARERDPRGSTLPAYDADYEVLEAVLAGELPVYFAVESAPDILRVLGLADEYGFRPLIVGGGEAWKVAAELRERDIPVLVSTDFDEPRRWKPSEDTAAAEPLDAPALREKQTLEDRYANAGRLVEAGVTVALTSGGTGEILEGARKAVEYGLPESAALAALTRTPADLLGIPSVVRLEPGLPATFLVTTGPLFEDETKVAYTFVEGLVEEASEAPEAGRAEDAVAFGGEWELTLEMEDEPARATLRVEQEGARFTGSFEYRGEEGEVTDGVIDGDEISGVVTLEIDEEELEIRLSGTVEGDEASGEADLGPDGVVRWTARRVGPGGAR